MGLITEHLRHKVEEEAAKKSPLVWVDSTGEYTDVVRTWCSSKNSLRYPLFAFNGSFLELMISFKDILSKKNAVPSIIYLPGFLEKDLSSTPIFEAAAAGRLWTMPLEKIIHESGEGQLRSDQIEYILASDSLSALKADSLADGMVTRSPELEAALSAHGEDGLVIDFLNIEKDLTLPLQTMLEHIDRVFGCTSQWFIDWNTDTGARNETAWAFGAYLLCLEYVKDLSIEPPGKRLTFIASQDEEYRSRASRILHRIRTDKPLLYKSLVEKTELYLEDGEKILNAEHLGSLDTFRFEANSMLNAALMSLRESNWNRALSYAEPRLREDTKDKSARTFWLKNEPSRENMWKWINTAAELGKELRNAGQSRSPTFRAAFELYVSGEWRIDSLHREYKLLTNSVNTQSYFPDIADYYSIRNTMNTKYREWADKRSHEWNDLCLKEGFNILSEFAQRGFFSRSVLPYLKTSKKTALILVDALRYELGEELAELLKDYSNGDKILSPLLAELPTITSVGMNVLMPVEKDGKLYPVFDKAMKKVLGFRAGERNITDPKSRIAALSDVTQKSCEWAVLTDFLKASDNQLKPFIASSLCVLTTRQIDTQGENDDEDFGIDFFQPVLARIRESVEKLRSLGFERILITSDHGFLIGDETVEKAQGNRLEVVERRHAFDIERSGERLCSVSLQNLGWEVENRNTHLVFEKGTHVLTNTKARTFYHGGNSPQERIIPLITLSGSVQNKEKPERCRVNLENLPPVFGTSRIRIIVNYTKEQDLFGPDRVELRLIPENGFMVTIGDAEKMRFTGDTFECLINTPVTISFKIYSRNGGKTKISINQVGTQVFVDPVEITQYFDSEIANIPVVSFTGTATDTGRADKTFVFPADSIPGVYETAIRHLANHGKLSETFLRNSLGNESSASRLARRFASCIEDWKTYLPFSITVHTTTDGIEYRKE